MADGVVGSCGVASTPFLFSLLVLLFNASTAAAQTLSNVEAISIITAIFLIFMIFNFVLLVALFAWCRQEREKRRREWTRSRIRQRSLECLDEPRLKKVSVIQEEVEENEEFKVSIETSFQNGEEKRRSTISNEYLTVDMTSSSSSREMSPERGSAIGEESHYESKSFESRRKESQGKRSEQRRESEKLLLEGDSEDSLKPMSLLPSLNAIETVNEDHESSDELKTDIPSFNKKRTPVARQQSSDYRRDADASLVENEIIVEALSPLPTFELEISKDGVPNGSQVDTQVLAETSFSGTEPIQHLSIDQTHSEGTADFNSSSATSIGWSSVTKILSGVESDVNGLHQNKGGGGKLAQEGLLELLDGSYGKNESLNYSLTGSIDDTTVTPNSSFASASYSGVSPGAAFNSSIIEINHGRAQSFDRTTAKSKYSPSTYYTPQHAVPRPRGSDPSKFNSISLTSSPIRTKRKDTK